MMIVIYDHHISIVQGTGATFFFFGGSSNFPEILHFLIANLGFDLIRQKIRLS
jgi:hypothetical protein